MGGREGGSAKIAGFEPVTLFAALAPLTRNIGFIATSSTTYEEPYTVARKFASLDLISNGRAAWNVVTSTGDETARNFSRESQPSHAERYARAGEHVAAVKYCGTPGRTTPSSATRRAGASLTRASFTTRIYGSHLSVKGPLNVPRSAQGHPVIVQAGQSEDGRRLAGATAEVIFTAHQSLASAQEFYRDIKARAKSAGRNPNHVLVMPGVAPFVGRTEEEARRKYEELNDLILPQDAIALLNTLSGSTLDLSDYPLDGPLPPSPETEGMKSRQALIRQIADDNGFTIRQLYQWVATARGHYMIVGTLEQVADALEEWFVSEAADGFNILPPWLPGALDDFIEMVIPILQERGLFRTAYEGSTLRENLGLPYPENPWRRADPAVQAAE